MSNPLYRYKRLINNKLLRTLAKITSVICHPVFMPILVTLLLFLIAPAIYDNIPLATKTRWVLIIIINTIMFPLITIGLLKKLNFIPSVQMHSSKERIIPLIAMMIFYFWPYWVLRNLNVPFSLRVFFLGNFWGVILVFMINIFTKISMHTAAAGGFIGIVLVVMFSSSVDLFLPFLCCLLGAGIIGTARLILGAHKPKDIYIGYTAGVIAQLAAYGFLLKWG